MTASKALARLVLSGCSVTFGVLFAPFPLVRWPSTSSTTAALRVLGPVSTCCRILRGVPWSGLAQYSAYSTAPFLSSTMKSLPTSDSPFLWPAVVAASLWGECWLWRRSVWSLHEI